MQRIIHLAIKGPRLLLGEMSDFSAGAEKIQDEPSITECERGRAQK